MKKFICFLLLSGCIILSQLSYAQIKDPAHWAYGLKKISANQYEVHIRATIDPGWHIYAQKQTPDFVGTATKIRFEKVPGLTIKGLPAEVGKKEKYEIKEAGVTNFEYSGVVDFVQKVNIEPTVKEVKGSITYQTCTHEKCLVAQEIQFSIPVPAITNK